MDYANEIECRLPAGCSSAVWVEWLARCQPSSLCGLKCGAGQQFVISQDTLSTCDWFITESESS